MALGKTLRDYKIVMNVIIYSKTLTSNEIVDSISFSHHVNITSSEEDLNNPNKENTPTLESNLIDLYVIDDRIINYKNHKNFTSDNINEYLRNIKVDYFLGIEDEYFCYKQIFLDFFMDGNKIIFSAVMAEMQDNSFRVIDSKINMEAIEELANKFNLSEYFSISKVANGTNVIKYCDKINNRIVLYRLRGVNIPLMIVQSHLGRKLIACNQNFISEIFLNRTQKIKLKHQFDYVYCDLDGTLILDEGISNPVLCFLKNMKTQGKTIVLITRHLGDPKATLIHYDIDLNIFFEIIHLTSGQKKSDYINHKAIFIDNEFPERYDVYSTLNIPSFDVDAINTINFYGLDFL